MTATNLNWVRGFINRRADLAAAIYGASQYIYFNLVGRLMMAELFASVYLLTINVPKMLGRLPELRRILLGYGIVLISLIFSDIYNETPPSDSLRGWFSLVFAMITTTFLTAQFLRSATAPYFFLAAVTITRIVLPEDDVLTLARLQENSNSFKTQFVPFLFPGVVLTACLIWQKQRMLAALLFIGVSVFFVLFDARSAGLVLFLAGVLLLIQAIKIRPSLSQIVVASLVCSVIFYGAYVIYVNQVLYHGIGGANAQQLLKTENPYNPFELLYYGRSEFVVSAKAISDRPFMGFGSWAQDTFNTYAIFQHYLFNEKIFNAQYLSYIPTHSVLLTSWLWAGLGGFIGMVIVIATIMRLFLSCFWTFSPLAPALCAYFLNTAWGAFFSPFGHIRNNFPFVIALLIAGSLLAQSSQRAVPASHCSPR